MSNSPTTPPVETAAAQGAADHATALMGAPVTFRSKLIEPPSQLYIQQDDKLLVTIYNSFPAAQGNAVVTVFGRILEPSGRLVPFEQDLQVPSPSMPAAYLIGLSEGFLLSVSLGSGAGSVQRGQVYASLQLARGNLNRPQILGMLAADYVTFTNLVSWPFGGIHNPLIGEGAVLTQGSTSSSSAQVSIGTQRSQFERWKILALNFNVITSSVAGTRMLQIQYNTTIVPAYFYQFPTAIPASTTLQFSAGKMLGVEQDVITGGFAAISIPEFVLDGNESLAIILQGAQVGDLWNSYAIAYEQNISV